MEIRWENNIICFICSQIVFFFSSGNDTSGSNEFNNSSIITCENVSRSIDDFPPDFFTDDQRRHGAVVFHFLVAFYGFVFIAFVCNDYFLPSVFCICLGMLHLSKKYLLKVYIILYILHTTFKIILIFLIKKCFLFYQ